MATSAAPADALIHARGLTKRFANLVAVDAIDFDVERLTTGMIGPSILLDIAYLVILGAAALALAATRLERLLLK
jgi:hypothetical protein